MNRILRGAWALAAIAVVALSACSDDEKKCEDFCGAGAACVGGSCQPVQACSPACGAGQACQDGACVATLASACGGSCGTDQICVTGGGAASCVAVCGAGQAWNSTTRTCDATAAYCGAGMTWDATTNACRLASGASAHAAYFDGKTLANGPAVTAECIKCHAAEAADFMLTQHWTWKGPTPELYDLVDFVADPAVAQNPGTIGKANLINNFCVSVTSNEKRCEQCHAGYGKDGKSARDPANAGNATLVDCLICHSGLVKGNMGAGYAKVQANFGAAGYTVTTAATAEQLKAAASAIQRPTRDNCGFCHFNAGGADSVKIMSTSLTAPVAAVDVHMTPGTATLPGLNLTCASCHAASNHRMKGAGIHIPTNTARVSCEECHTAPHATSVYASMINGHLDTVACQTCHIPAYSRGQPGKIDWDWATAGYKSKGSIYVCLDASNVETAPAADGTCPTGQWKVKAYDPMKGHFKWGINVKPTYAWYNGKMTHVTTQDKGAFTGSQTGLSATERITLAAPLGSSADLTAKIYPFKLMNGRQAVYVDGANSFVIAPNLFQATAGDFAFWTVSTHASYVYTPAAGEVFGTDPLGGTYVAPDYPTTAAGTAGTLASLLSTNFTTGALKAGQISSGVTLDKLDSVTGKGWDWRFTQMYMDLNHEVAPKANALACDACHGTTPIMDFTQLGYTCPNPSSCPKRK